MYILMFRLMYSLHDSLTLIGITFALLIKDYQALYILSRVVTRRYLNELLTLQNLVYFLCANL